MKRLFTLATAWSGGDFELDIFWKNACETSVKGALVALWDYPALDGCWLKENVEPAGQPRVSADWNSESVPTLYGVATLPDKTQCACRSTIVNDNGGSWLNLGLPLGSLSQFYPVGGYPFEKADVSWINPLSEWLAEIARSIFAKYPFDCGTVGFEVCGETVCESEIPKERSCGFLRNEKGKLIWYPPTSY
ncbi:MAG: hypothetical protein ABFD64_10230 [Armatimonadota bacterium]